MHAHTQAGAHAHKQTDRQTHTNAHTETHKQTHRHTDTHTHTVRAHTHTQSQNYWGGGAEEKKQGLLLIKLVTVILRVLAEFLIETSETELTGSVLKKDLKHTRD